MGGRRRLEDAGELPEQGRPRQGPRRDAGEPEDGKLIDMDKELLKRARNLEDRIFALKENLERLQVRANPSSLLKIEVNQFYGDMGRSFTNMVIFKGDIAELLFMSIVKILEAQIAILEQQLDAI